LYFESIVEKGSKEKKGLVKTGQLGDVMNESASIAYSFVKCLIFLFFSFLFFSFLYSPFICKI